MRLYGGGDVETKNGLLNTAQSLLLSDCHFDYPCGNVATLPQKESDVVCTKTAFYTPTHSGETWQSITKVRKWG